MSFLLVHLHVNGSEPPEPGERTLNAIDSLRIAYRDQSTMVSRLRAILERDEALTRLCLGGDVTKLIACFLDEKLADCTTADIIAEYSDHRADLQLQLADRARRQLRGATKHYVRDEFGVFGAEFCERALEHIETEIFADLEFQRDWKTFFARYKAGIEASPFETRVEHVGLAFLEYSSERKFLERIAREARVAQAARGAMGSGRP